MEENKITMLVVIIFSMMVVTAIPRIAPFFLHQKHLPLWLKSIVEYIPPAIIASITISPIVVLLLSKKSSILDARVLSAIPTLVIAYFSKNLIVTIIGGLVIYNVLIYVISR